MLLFIIREELFRRRTVVTVTVTPGPPVDPAVLQTSVPPQDLPSRVDQHRVTGILGRRVRAAENPDDIEEGVILVLGPPSGTQRMCKTAHPQDARENGPVHAIQFAGGGRGAAQPTTQSA